MNTLPFVLVSGPLCPGMCLRKTKHSSHIQALFFLPYNETMLLGFLCLFIIHAATVETVLYSLVPHVCCL